MTAHEDMLAKLEAGGRKSSRHGIAGYDRDGELYSSLEITKKLILDVNSGKHITRRVNNMTSDIDKASDIIDKSYVKFDNSLKRLMDKQGEASESTKRVSGKVRDSTQKLGDGLAKIEKLANFDRLENYVLLLERAEKAISSLANLEKSGKLEKIAAAVR
jgi:hypothetical protein